MPLLYETTSIAEQPRMDQHQLLRVVANCRWWRRPLLPSHYVSAVAYRENGSCRSQSSSRMDCATNASIAARVFSESVGQQRTTRRRWRHRLPAAADRSRLGEGTVEARGQPIAQLPAGQCFRATFPLVRFPTPSSQRQGTKPLATQHHGPFGRIRLASCALFREKPRQSGLSEDRASAASIPPRRLDTRGMRLVAGHFEISCVNLTRKTRNLSAKFLTPWLRATD